MQWPSHFLPSMWLIHCLLIILVCPFLHSVVPFAALGPAGQPLGHTLQSLPGSHTSLSSLSGHWLPSSLFTNQNQLGAALGQIHCSQYSTAVGRHRGQGSATEGKRLTEACCSFRGSNSRPSGEHGMLADMVLEK